MTDNLPPLIPVIQPTDPAQNVAMLTLAYNKHVGALAAIESSQQSLLNLVLAIYSAALTLLVGLYKDNPEVLLARDCLLSPLGWVLVIAGAALMGYTYYMSHNRNEARTKMRKGLERIDHALGFFEPGRYLKGDTLYPRSYGEYTQRTFLDWTYVIVYLPAIAFILAVVILSHAG